jgi:hypothetical protein
LEIPRQTPAQVDQSGHVTVLILDLPDQMHYSETKAWSAMNVTIELSDEQAAALAAKAAAMGLSLEAWFQKLARDETQNPKKSGKNRYNLSDLLRQCDPSVPLSTDDQAWLDAPATGREAI